MNTLVLLTQPASSPLAWHAYQLVRTLLQQQQSVQVFFYQDAASIANQLAWRPEDEPNLGLLWQQLGVDLPVCVSTALFRGISDADNAKRHQLANANLNPGFRLTGLGELAEAMLQAKRTVQL